MLVAGAKNIDGYKAWIYSNLVASNDPEIAKAGREQSKEEYDWSDTLLDRIEMMNDPKTSQECLISRTVSVRILQVQKTRITP